MNEVAYWSISLDTTCPKCDHDFDLTNTDDFWYGVDPIEQDTPRTTGFEVICPECEHEFEVDFAY